MYLCSQMCKISLEDHDVVLIVDGKKHELFLIIDDKQPRVVSYH